MVRNKVEFEIFKLRSEVKKIIIGKSGMTERKGHGSFTSDSKLVRRMIKKDEILEAWKNVSVTKVNILIKLFEAMNTLRSMIGIEKTKTDFYDDEHIADTARKMISAYERSRPCKVCGKRKPRNYCSKCKLTVYCSGKCQKDDWKKHRKICCIPNHEVKEWKHVVLDTRFHDIGWMWDSSKRKPKVVFATSDDIHKCNYVEEMYCMTKMNVVSSVKSWMNVPNAEVKMVEEMLRLMEILLYSNGVLIEKFTEKMIKMWIFILKLKNPCRKCKDPKTHEVCKKCGIIVYCSKKCRMDDHDDHSKYCCDVNCEVKWANFVLKSSRIGSFIIIWDAKNNRPFVWWI